MKLRLLIFAALVLFVPPALAQRERDTYSPNSQAFEVSGEVRLTESGSTVANIPVRLERFSGGLIDQISTDNRGRFRFPGFVYTSVPSRATLDKRYAARRTRDVVRSVRPLKPLHV